MLMCLTSNDSVQIYNVTQMHVVWEVSIASERRMRVRAKELVGDHLIAEKAPFSFTLKEGGEEIRLAPYIYVVSLWDKVSSMLDQLDR